MTAIVFLGGMLLGSLLSLVFFSEIHRHQQERIDYLAWALEEAADALRVEEAVNAMYDDEDFWLTEQYDRSEN
jgi:hypothetical protein